MPLLTVLTKIFLDFFRGSFLAYSSNKDLPCLGLLGLGLRCCRLGINLLAINNVRGDGKNFLKRTGTGKCYKAKSSTPLKINTQLTTYFSHNM